MRRVCLITKHIILCKLGVFAVVYMASTTAHGSLTCYGLSVLQSCLQYIKVLNFESLFPTKQNSGSIISVIEPNRLSLYFLKEINLSIMGLFGLLRSHSRDYSDDSYYGDDSDYSDDEEYREDEDYHDPRCPQHPNNRKYGEDEDYHDRRCSQHSNNLKRQDTYDRGLAAGRQKGFSQGHQRGNSHG